jgi:catechol 2,3-dioxygenase-like lactoylglutathione lyase family enzyme
MGISQGPEHGPWPGREAGSCCPAPLNVPGTADLCFVWPGTTDSVLAHVSACGLEVHEGPMPRFGARGWGSSVYVLDPDGNSVELICYSTTS